MIASIGLFGLAVILVGALAALSNHLGWLNTKKDRNDFRRRWDENNDKRKS